MFTKILILTVVVAVAIKSVAPQTYSTEFTSSDVDALIANPTAFAAFKDCIIGDGACSTAGAEFKTDFADAIATGCSKCVDAQKVLSKKVVDGLQAQFADDFNAYLAEVDPTGANFPVFMSVISAVP